MIRYHGLQHSIVAPTLSHIPFYEIAGKYLPSDKNSIIIDIGAGDGSFANHLQLTGKYKNLYLLDGNIITIEKLKSRFKNVVLYKVPEKLPFADAAVNYVHCSHLVEHFYHQDLFNLIEEIDRVLAEDGILVISTPLLWEYFYSDMSHVKPYNPEVFIRYLCHSENPSHSKEIVSREYTVLELVWRYWPLNLGQGWGSDFYAIHCVIELFKRLLLRLKCRKYIKNGYTLVLKKAAKVDVEL